MNLRLLAPDIQEQILGVNNPVVGLDMINLKEVIPINTCAALGFSKDHVAKLQARVS